MVKNSKGALFALAAAGGLWAWQNRDKVQGWLNTARNQIESNLESNRTFTGETRRMEATGLFIAIGHDPRSELLTGQVDLDDEGYVLVQPGSTATNLPGVFAAGDCTTVPYKQIVIAMGEGSKAALSAFDYIIRNAPAEDVAEAA